MQSSRHQDGCFRHLFEELDDPVVKFELVDGDPIIRHANAAFTAVFGFDSETVLDEPLNELIVPAEKRQEAQQFDQRTEAGESNAAVVERRTEAGVRKFVYRGVPYDDDHGFAIYADITDELQRERHLDVLHRVLRHNLRNDLSVILGMATKILDETDDTEIREAAGKIQSTAGQLSQLSDEAKTIERVLGESVAVDSVAVEPLVDDVVADCKSRFETATFNTEIEGKPAVKANDQLQIVLRSLLDNAIRHNDSADPRATVSASEFGSSTVELTVRDNGPGIPAVEQQIITEDDEITPLNHGSGLGLWLVKWIVDAYGGRIEINTPASGGTVVRLYLNRAELARQ